MTQVFVLQNLHNEYPYHIDTLLQLGEILKMGDDRQAAAELIGTEEQTDNYADTHTHNHTPF